MMLTVLKCDCDVDAVVKVSQYEQAEKFSKKRKRNVLLLKLKKCIVVFTWMQLIGIGIKVPNAPPNAAPTLLNNA